MSLHHTIGEYEIIITVVFIHDYPLQKIQKIRKEQNMLHPRQLFPKMVPIVWRRFNHPQRRMMTDDVVRRAIPS